VTSDFISSLGFYEVTFAHSDCDTVYNLLFACNFFYVVHVMIMIMSINCAMSDS